ncbi:hypothetical protein [Peribacillus simplex]
MSMISLFIKNYTVNEMVSVPWMYIIGVFFIFIHERTKVKQLGISAPSR